MSMQLIVEASYHTTMFNNDVIHLITQSLSEHKARTLSHVYQSPREVASSSPTPRPPADTTLVQGQLHWPPRVPNSGVHYL